MGFRSLVPQHFPLGDTEAVLLICNDESQLVIDDLLLDQRMSSHNNVRLVALDFLVGHALFLCRHGTGQKDRFLLYAVGGKQFLHGFQMLPCQHLRRHHQRSLIPVVCRLQKSQDRDNRLSGAHISLHQPVHHLAP